MSESAETVPLGALQPSQLYVDVSRLRGVLEWFDPDDPVDELRPLPVLSPTEDLGLDAGRLDGPVLSDGHTRAFACVLAGAEAVPIRRDPDREELSLSVYRTCVEWCFEAGLVSPHDLTGRVVSRETFLEEWVARCEALDEHPANGAGSPD